MSGRGMFNASMTVAATIAVFAALITPAVAPSPAGEAAAAASPTPGTAPMGSATIIVRNTLNGVPLIRISWSLSAFVGGHFCQPLAGVVTPAHLSGGVGTSPASEPPFMRVVTQTSWPWHHEGPCNSTGVPVSICVAGVCSEEFVFTGEDATVDAEWSVLPRMLELPAVTVHFSHAGVTQPVTLVEWSFESGAVSCGRGTTIPVVLSSLVRVWSGFTIFPCQTLAQEISASFITEEFGELKGSFTWLGEDATVEIDTGLLLTTASPTPSPLPTPTPATSTPATPAALPEAGGPPAGTGSGVAVLVSAAGLLALLGVIGLATRRRRA